MDIQVEEVSPVRKKVNVAFTPERVQEEIDQAYGEISKNANIKGFRPGKVPRKVLESHYGEQMQQQVVETLLREGCEKAILGEEIPAVAAPEIVERGPVESGSAFNFAAEVQVRPHIEPQNYTGLKVQKEIFEPNPKAGEERLQEMLESRAELQVSERDAAQEGDHVTIDFEGSIDGEAFDQGAAQDYSLQLGSNTFIPGFEEQIVGMQRGQQREIEVTFPEDYGNKELAGQKVQFQVTLKEIKEKKQPELNDEFAQGMGQNSVDELRQHLQETYEQNETQRIDEEARERLLDELLKENTFDVPEAMIERQLEQMYQAAAQRLQSQGLSMEMLGLNQETFNQRYHEQGEKQVKVRLLLQAIAEKEGIAAADEDMEARIEKVVEQTGLPEDQVRAFFNQEENQEGLKSEIVEEKVMDYLMNQAQVEEVSAATLQQEQAAAEETAEKE